MENWTLERLHRMLPSSFKCDVFTSYTHRFTYWDESKNVNGYNFVPPCQKQSMAYQEFYSYIQSSSVTSSSQTYPNLYLQQGTIRINVFQFHVQWLLYYLCFLKDW